MTGAPCHFLMGREKTRKENLNAEALEESARKAQTNYKRVAKSLLAEVGDFLVEVGQGGFERFAVLGVGSGGEIVHDADTRKLQVLAPLFAL